MRDRQALIRPVLLLALLLVSTASVDAAAHAPQTTGTEVRALSPVLNAATAVVFGSCALLALWVLISLVRRIRRRRGDDEVPPMVVYRPQGAMAQVAALAGMALLITGIVLAVIYLGHHRPGTAPANGVSRGPGSSPTPVHQHSAPSTTIAHHASQLDLSLTILGVLLALVALSYLLHRRLSGRRHAGFAGPEPDRVRTELADAIDRATQGLNAQGTPREDIIACYRSMEHGLRSAGIDRYVSDTPEELLARAAELGIALPSAALRLTELFREARFSIHPMSPDQRRQAAAALDALRIGVLAER